MPRELENAEPLPERRPWHERLLHLILIAGTLLIPLVVLRGTHDSFRRPKDLALYALTIVLLSVITAAAVMGKRPLRMFRTGDRILQVILAGMLWTLITAALSTNHGVSAGSAVRVAAIGLIFAVTVAIARHAHIHYIAAVVVPAVINSLLAISQELSIWNPFGAPPGTPHHIRTTGFIGNPNDVGTYLALAALAAVVAAVVMHGRARSGYIAAAVIIIAGLVASQTLTAIGALAIAASTLAVMISWKRALSAIALAVAVLILAIVSYQPYRERFQNMTTFLRTGNYNALLTNRLTPFASALEMIRDRPLAGVGPGCFAWQYFPYKVRAEKRYPELREAFNRGTNFGEVHNDHLQVAAEFGIPGYLLLLAAVVTIGAFSRQPRDEKPTAEEVTMRTRTAREETTRGRRARLKRERAAAMAVSRRRLGRLMALPLAVCFLVLALTQFPLQLAATSHLLATLAALCAGWSRP